MSEEKIGFVVSKEQAFFQIVNCIEGVYEEEFVALSAVYYSLIGEVIAYSETGTYQILSFESLSNAQQQNLLEAVRIYIRDMKSLSSKIEATLPLEENLVTLETFLERHNANL